MQQNSLLRSPEIDSLRPYQKEGVGILLRDIVRHAQNGSSEVLGEEVTERVQKIQNLRAPETIERPSENVGLVDMTMGSGKTRVFGEFLRRTLRLRNKFLPEKPLNILVLSDRINLVDQLEWDLISGRDGKTGMLEWVLTKSKNPLNIQRIHSQNTDRNLVLKSAHDNIVLSTIQSVGKVEGEWDIIIVDEADSVLTNGSRDLFSNMVESQEHAPYVLGFTGTVDQNLVDLLGPPLYSYDIDEYLRSPYAPDIDYHLMTANHVTPAEVAEIQAMITSAQTEKGIPQKKRLEREIRKAIEKVLARFDGYESVVRHLISTSGIDLSKRTLLFVSSIEEADRVAKLINQELSVQGSDFRAKALHSETDESDLSVLGEFRADNHLSILVTVNKLNRGTDVPTIENIISLRDTDSKRVFMQQIGRGMRGDLTRIYDYTPSLTNLIWMHDILSSKIPKRSRPSGGKWWDGYGDWCPGFMVGTNTSLIDPSLIDFFGLVGTYIDQVNTKRELVSVEDWKEILEEHGVTNGDELFAKWVMWFGQTFGLASPGIFLEKTIWRIKMIYLREIAEKLWWEMTIKERTRKTVLWSTKEEILASLARFKITNGDELKDKWPAWFCKTFWKNNLAKFQKTVSIVSFPTLQEFANELWWEMTIKERTRKTVLWSTKEEILASLARFNITNGDELIAKGVVWFRSTFRLVDLEKFLGRIPKNRIVLADVYELTKRLWWDIEQWLWITIDSTRISLIKYGITNGDELIKKWPKWFQKTFGASDLGKILGRMLQRIVLSDLQELADKLGWTLQSVDDLRIWMIESLRNYGITNGDELTKKWSVWFQKTFGKSDLVKILERKILHVTLQHLQDLSDKLGW